MKRILLLVLLLAGCTEATEDVEETAIEQMVIAAPEWQLGDAWSYGDTTIVVTGESGGDWIVDTTSADQALYDAQTDVSYLGEVRKSDLAGSQQGSRVQFFDFPLEAGKQWSTDWDGRRLSIEVAEIAPGRAIMQGTDGGELYVEYEYTSDARFFAMLTFFENGTAAYQMALDEATQGFAGEYVRYTILDRLEFKQTGAGEKGGDIDFPAEATELSVIADADCQDSAAGNVGMVVTSRTPDRAYTPQFAVVTEKLEFDHTITCQATPQAMESAVLDVDDSRIYAIDYGVVAPAGEMLISIEPRILERLQL